MPEAVLRENASLVHIIFVKEKKKLLAENVFLLKI